VFGKVDIANEVLPQTFTMVKRRHQTVSKQHLPKWWDQGRFSLWQTRANLLLGELLVTDSATASLIRKVGTCSLVARFLGA
jgi:hypothetical protein